MAKPITEYPEGYVVPLHRSLTRPMMWFGVPRTILILFSFLGILGVFIFQSLIFGGICFLCLLFARYLASKDNQFHQVLWAKRYYQKTYSN